MPPILGMLGAAALSGGMGMLSADQQNKTNRSNMEWSEDAQNRLADRQMDRQLQMWKKTGIAGQKAELEKAGMNAALLYGGGGSGGQSQSVGGATPSAPQGSGAANPQLEQSIGMGMQMANLKLMEAQTKKTEAEAEKIAGVDTASATADVTAKQFQNAINKLVGEENFAKNIGWANQKLSYESQKTMAEYNAWAAANFAGKPTDDPNSPIAKAISAGLEQSITELKKAKAEANTAEAEAVIKRFTASLTKQGIAEGSPWYVKMATDLLNKAGINVNETAADSLNK